MKAADLRKSILQAAVQGKLVPQNPHDEPATKLLEWIRKEKTQLVKEGKIKKEKPLPPISEEEIPFDLPEGWAWCRFGDITTNRDSERIPVSRSERQRREKIYDYYGASGVIDKIDGFLFDKTLLLIGEDGANLLARSTPIAFIANGKYWVNNHAHVIDCQVHDVIFYLCVYINAIGLHEYVTGTAQPKMNQEKMNSIVVAVPPLAEQGRIVSKVNELIVLCDEFEIAEKELDTLESQFAEYLPKSILQAAVQGKLVPQNIHDEPADKLLERIRAEKAKLVKAGKLKKEKPLPPITEEEIPYDPPDGWTWCRLGEVALFVTSGSRDWAKYYSSNGALFLRMGNLSKDSFSLRLDSLQHVSPPKDTEGQRTRLEPHDILVSITGDVGNLGYIPEGFGEAYINQHTALVRLPAILHNLYIPFAFLSKHCKEQFATPQRGIKNSFRLTDLTYLLIPIPPLAEQQRIVAKVNELMSLCDALKAAHDTPVGTPIAAAVIPFPHQEEEPEMLMAARGPVAKAPSKALQDARNSLFED